ncbi:RnfABCDGE type electron transport complex subunit D [Tepidibacillus marianensis]|uniref:RnfABCDGE type electron transport complex subunit D n=1 Tax=Tepidibacillus marianensis TaxID=3131995 RepID=UPI0030CC4BFB
MNQKNKKNFFTTPKGYVLVVLILLTLISEVFSYDLHGPINLIVSIFTAATIDLLFGLTQERSRLFPDGAIVTGWIIALVLSTVVPWYIVVFTSATAILSKNLMKIKKKPVFNPAAFGLLIVILLFSSGQSWWGGMSTIPLWAIIFLLIGGYLTTQKVNKFPQVLSFLSVFFIFTLIFGLLKNGNVGDLLRVPYINSTLFLAFFMLTDPPTSPAKYKDQVLFGIIVALISIFDYVFGTVFPSY